MLELDKAVHIQLSEGSSFIPLIEYDDISLVSRNVFIRTERDNNIIFKLVESLLNVDNFKCNISILNCVDALNIKKNIGVFVKNITSLDELNVCLKAAKSLSAKRIKWYTGNDIVFLPVMNLLIINHISAFGDDNSVNLLRRQLELSGSSRTIVILVDDSEDLKLLFDLNVYLEFTEDGIIQKLNYNSKDSTVINSYE